MRALRVLHVTPYFADAWAYGGIPRVAAALAQGLAERGHDVTVCATDACSESTRLTGSERGNRFLPWVPAATAPGVVVRVFPNVSNRLAYQQMFVPLGLGEYLKRSAGSFDVAHLHACRNLPGVIAARHLRRAGVPYVLAPNGTALRIEHRQLAKRVFDIALGGRVLGDAARVLAVSDAERAQLRSIGIAPDAIRLVANPVDLKEFQTPVTRGRFRHAIGVSGPLVLFLGRITTRKRLDVLVRAFARLLEGPAEAGHYVPSAAGHDGPSGGRANGPSGVGYEVPSGAGHGAPLGAGRVEPLSAGHDEPSGAGHDGPLGAEQQARLSAGQDVPFGIGHHVPSGARHHFHSDARLVIAGNDAGSAGAAARLAASLGVRERIVFTGLLRGRERLEALADADVLVYPSQDEIFGLVPLEALLCGTPVIVADDSGCAEIVRGVGGGQIVPLGDVEALTRAINLVLENPARWRAAADRAAVRVRATYAPDVVCADLDDVYRELVGAG
jgi:glycosyltransferase involved in cell wall biosynthesis